jgi:hypothetical protein
VIYNNSINTSKLNHHLSHPIIAHKKTMTYDIRNLDTGCFGFFVQIIELGIGYLKDFSSDTYRQGRENSGGLHKTLI